MLGLALGGWFGNRLAPWRVPSALMWLEGAQATLVIALPVLLRALAVSPVAFVLLSPVAGLLTGGIFPLAARLSLTSGARPGTVAGLLDAADHGGALLGAAGMGLFLVPALGLGDSAAVLALAKCAGLAALAATLAGRAPARR